MKRFKIKRLEFTRKQLVLAFIGASVLLLGALIAWDILVWRSYVSASRSSYDDAKNLTTDRLKSVDKASDIRDLSNQLSDRAKDLCKAPPSASIRSSLREEYRLQLEECASRQDALAATSRALHDLHKQLDDEGLVARIIADTNEKMSKVEAGDYVAMRDHWRAALDRIPSGAMEERATDVSNEVAAGVREIVDRYDQLVIAALESQDRTKFDDAVVELTKSHESLQQLSTKYREQYKEQVDQVHSGIMKL